MTTTPNDPAASVPVILLTPAELANRWRISTRTLDRWRSEHFGLAWTYIGGSVRYALADVEAYEERNRCKAGRRPA